MPCLPDGAYPGLEESSLAPLSEGGWRVWAIFKPAIFADLDEDLDRTGEESSSLSTMTRRLQRFRFWGPVDPFGEASGRDLLTPGQLHVLYCRNSPKVKLMPLRFLSARSAIRGLGGWVDRTRDFDIRLIKCLPGMAESNVLWFQGGGMGRLVREYDINRRKATGIPGRRRSGRTACPSLPSVSDRTIWYCRSRCLLRRQR